MVDMEETILYKQMCSRLTLQNNSKGFFYNLVDSILPLLSIRDFMENNNSDLERVRFLAENCWDRIHAEMIFRGKDLDEARARKSEGNAEFETGNHALALKLYSQAIIRCPVGQELALIYSNRSALHQKMGEFEYAINDVELALGYNYPESGRHKLYERMASCHLHLHNYPKAKIAINLAKHFAEKHKDEVDEKFEKKLQKICEKLEEQTPGSNGVNSSSPHQNGNGIHERNPILRAASSKMEVAYAPNYGRYSRVKDEFECEIKTGEEVLREDPFAAVLNQDCMGTHCSNCFNRLKSPVACDKCAAVAFCSKSCRSKAESYHQYECPVFGLLFGSGMSQLCYLALRIITKIPVEELLEKMPKFESNPEEVLTTEGGVYESSYEAIYNLSALEHQREPKDYLERSIMALFLMKCLRLVGYFHINIFKNPLPTEDELKVASLLLRNLQVLQFNAYEINEFMMDNKENFRKSTTKSIGIGIYSTASFFNHSCAPNVTRYFIGPTLIIKAIRRIKPGEAICDNYGPLSTKMLKKARQHKLTGRYWFTCNCEACDKDWPPLAEMPMEIEPRNKSHVKSLKRLKKLEETYYDKAFELMDKGKGAAGTSIELLCKFLDECQDIVEDFQPYKTFFLAQEALKICMLASGSVFTNEFLK